MRDGDIVGEMSLLTGAPRTATVTALSPTLTLEIAKQALAAVSRGVAGAGRSISPAMVLRRSAELDALYGPPNWLRAGGAAHDIAERIRRFFSRAG